MMLSRASLLLRKAAPAGNRSILARRAYHAPSDWKPPHMNDLPVPQGSWKAHHDNMQKRFNMHLAGGITFAVFTFGVAKASGLFEFGWGPSMCQCDD